MMVADLLCLSASIGLWAWFIWLMARGFKNG